MENLNSIIQLLSERIEKILRKETALTPDDIRAVKELTALIIKLSHFRLLESQCNLEGKSNRSSEKSTKVGIDEVIEKITDAVETALKPTD